MKSKRYSQKDGVELYLEIHHIIDSVNEFGDAFKEDAKKAALDIILKLPAADVQIDSKQKLRDAVKIRSSMYRLKSFLEIIKSSSNITFPNVDEKLDEISSISDEMIRSIDWTKIKSEVEENDFEENDFEERDLS